MTTNGAADAAKDAPSTSTALRLTLGAVGLLTLLGLGVVLLPKASSDPERYDSEAGVGNRDDRALGSSAPPLPRSETAATTVAPTSAPGTSTAPTTDQPPATAPQPATDDGRPVRYAVYADGKVYLRGQVQNREVADEIIGKAAAVIGEPNVIDEYVVNPDAPNPKEAPLYVEDLILFESGSTAIAPDFEPLLGLGIVLLAQNPEVVITITGHTDTDGETDANLALSQARIDAIIDYMRAAGGDTTRLVADPRGESDPIADNGTEDGRTRNRRVEFVISGLVD